MIRPKIKCNQVWKNKRSSFQILITHKRGDKWEAKVLTDKTDFYNGTHTMSQYTIWKKFDLLV